MGIKTRVRALMSIGIGVVLAFAAIITASLLSDAAERFGWPLIVALSSAVAVGAFVIDVLTENRPE